MSNVTKPACSGSQVSTLALTSPAHRAGTPKIPNPHWTKAALAERLRAKLNEHVASTGGSFTPREAGPRPSAPGGTQYAPRLVSAPTDAGRLATVGAARQRTPRVGLRIEHFPGGSLEVLNEAPAPEASPRAHGDQRTQNPVANAACALVQELRSRGRAPSAPPDLAPRTIDTLEYSISHGLSPRGTLMALEGDTLKMERMRFRQAQDKNHRWLTKALMGKINEANREVMSLQKAHAQEAHADAVVKRREEDIATTVQIKREAREFREWAVYENNMNLDRQRQCEVDEYRRKEQEREEALATRRTLRREELAMQAAAESERHLDVLHEAQRLERERRDMVAEHVRVKDDKVTVMLSERQRLWDMRRELTRETAQTWETLRGEIERRARSADPFESSCWRTARVASPRT